MNLPENSDSQLQCDILDALPVLVFLERAGKIVFANAVARNTLGVDGEWTPRPVEDVVWGLFPGAAEPQTNVAGNHRGHPFHATLSGGGGNMVPVEGTYSVLNTNLREGIIVAQMSVRERTPKPRFMDDVLASIPEAVAIVYGNHILYVNPAFTEMFGYSADEVSGTNLRDLIVPETRQHENAMLQRMIDDYGKATIDTVRLNKRGELLDVAMQVGPLLVAGTRAGYVLTYRDIGDRKNVEARLQHDALHDTLTGLANHALFLDRVKLALNRRARRKDQNCGVLFLDIDRFKEINETLGHAAGDRLLIAMAERIRGILRPQDTAARLSDDEFAVLVENIVTDADLEAVAKRLQLAMERPFEVLGHSLMVAASIGAAIAAPERDTPEAMMRDADIAMYRAIHEGGHRYEIFDRHTELQLSTEVERGRQLRHVLDKREFELWYQPMYRLATGQIEGFEAVFRWRRPDGSLDPLRDFASMAEDAGLSARLMSETIEAVCLQLGRWADALAGTSIFLSVNLTYRQLYHEELVEQVKSVLHSTGANPSRLMLEVTESAVNEDPDRAVAVLQRLVDCGVRVALDDFGSNLAPLSHLVRLPIELVKLDPNLTLAVSESGRHLPMLEAVAHLTKSLGLPLLAQGIQNDAQLVILQGLGCELGQGHAFSLALEPGRAIQMVTGSTGSVALNA